MKMLNHNFLTGPEVTVGTVIAWEDLLGGKTIQAQMPVQN